jgi:hypothetical protein
VIVLTSFTLFWLPGKCTNAKDNKSSGEIVHTGSAVLDLLRGWRSCFYAWIGHIHLIYGQLLFGDPVFICAQCGVPHIFVYILLQCPQYGRNFHVFNLYSIMCDLEDDYSSSCIFNVTENLLCNCDETFVISIFLVDSLCCSAAIV